MKPTISEKLDNLFEVEEAPASPLVPRVPAQITSSGNDTFDLNADFNIARELLHNAAEKITDLADSANHVAKEKQDARSYEAAALIAKEARETALSMIDLHQRKASIVAPSNKGGGDNITNNNAVFVGTTAELRQMLKDVKLKSTLHDIEASIEPIDTK